MSCTRSKLVKEPDDCLKLTPVPRQILRPHEAKNSFKNIPDDIRRRTERPDFRQRTGFDVADGLLRLLDERLDLLHLNLDGFLPPKVVNNNILKLIRQRTY